MYIELVAVCTYIPAGVQLVQQAPKVAVMVVKGEQEDAGSIVPIEKLHGCGLGTRL